MLYEFLVTLFVFVCVFLILIILIQKSKGSIGIGGMGGGSQMLFGGSGGQDTFQKITWGLGAIFMFGSLVLALMRASGGLNSRYLDRTMGSQPIAQTKPELPAAPATQPESTEPADAPVNN